MDSDKCLGIGLVIFFFVAIADGLTKLRRYRNHPAYRFASYLHLFGTVCGLFGGLFVVARLYLDLYKLVRNGKLSSVQFGTFFIIFYPGVVACIVCIYDIFETFWQLELHIRRPEGKGFGPDTGDIYRNIKLAKSLYFEKFNGEDAGANDLRIKIRRRLIQAALCALVVGIDLIALSYLAGR